MSNDYAEVCGVGLAPESPLWALLDVLAHCEPSLDYRPAYNAAPGRLTAPRDPCGAVRKTICDVAIGEARGFVEITAEVTVPWGDQDAASAASDLVNTCSDWVELRWYGTAHPGPSPRVSATAPVFCAADLEAIADGVRRLGASLSLRATRVPHGCDPQWW